MFCKNCGNQINGGLIFCTNCGTKIQESAIKKRKFSILVTTILILSGIATIIIIIYSTIKYKNSDKISERTQNQIASAVVNIYCEGANGWDDETVSGGSGTIITEGGIVLTNAHVIPQGKDTSTEDKSCLVILPDPLTGDANEIYYARPWIIPDISGKYDLAFLEIDDVYYDEEEGRAYGEYPKKFPAYDGTMYCKNENVKLGEPIRVYGYSALSGGNVLTITDGIVSSIIIDEGLIFTSAKISSGNSGGIAVDEHGCRIGIPSMVSSDDNESLGVIISNNLIEDFTEEAIAFIDNGDF